MVFAEARGTVAAQGGSEHVLAHQVVVDAPEEGNQFRVAFVRVDVSCTVVGTGGQVVVQECIRVETAAGGAESFVCIVEVRVTGHCVQPVNSGELQVVVQIGFNLFVGIFG